jgi:predicted small secreted protein
MRTTLAKAFIALMLLTSTGALLSACHAVEGAGQDITSGGAAVHNATGAP